MGLLNLNWVSEHGPEFLHNDVVSYNIEIDMDLLSLVSFTVDPRAVDLRFSV